ncbi:MAG: phytanoyl-CoA dioxygenase family protein, partial [Anderseniella sp.]|nr:phytanoyl-CoA dioxygenase family protein [Anderseniella sp.]
MTPLWLLQLLHVNKSFEHNPIIGNRLLNRLGLHVLRLVLAHGITRLRWIFLAPLLSRSQRRMFREQGCLMLTDFLPADRFAALDAEVRSHRGEVRECIQGDTQTQRTLLDEPTLGDLPACASLIHDRTYRRLLQWAAVRYGQPLIFIEQVRNGVVSDGGADPQKNLHADTFHPTMKSWLYLDDVTEVNGPFAYVPGSNRLTWRRLVWEYRESVLGRDLPDRYARRGSLRLTGQDRLALGLPEPQRFTVPANTLLIANTFGFHARSAAEKDSTRLAIYADSRTNPFNPWLG